MQSIYHLPLHHIFSSPNIKEQENQVYSFNGPYQLHLFAFSFIKQKYITAKQLNEIFYPVYCVWIIQTSPLASYTESTSSMYFASTLTSISSLYLSRGASIMLRSLNVSVSTSKVWPVTLIQNRAQGLWKKKSPIPTKRAGVALQCSKESWWQSDLSNSLPVAWHHCLVGHELQ